MRHYSFFELKKLNQWLLPMLVISGCLTIAGFSHGLYSLINLSDIPSTSLINDLPISDQDMLQLDGYLRFSQISVTGFTLTFFFVVWLYFAARNLVAIYQERHQTLMNSVVIFTRLMLGIFFALRMMISMWRRSTPKSHLHESQPWLVPVWWLLLIAANVCKIISVYQLHNADSVSVWSDSYAWMIAAYCLYFPLYILTWRLALAMSRLQGLQWKLKDNDLDEVLGETFHVSGRGRKRFWYDPYPNIADGLSLVVRNFAGPSKKNLEGIKYIPRRTIANEIIPEVTVGFGGDVMMMFGKSLTVSEQLKDFYGSCDSVLLNMEGVITDKKKKGPDQKHDAAIVDQLKSAFSPEKTWLNFANNHAGDFGGEECRKSFNIFKEAGFKGFGLYDCPYADIHPLVRVMTGTQWSNRDDGDQMVWLDDQPEQHCVENKYNLLFPHWSYEMECFPRPWATTRMKHWLGKFDGVIGHHSHTPQPVMLEQREGVNVLAAYSLGGFCFGLARRNMLSVMHYGYGLTMRVSIGRLKSNPEKIAIGEIEWEFIECFPDANGDMLVDIVDQLPYFKV